MPPTLLDATGAELDECVRVVTTGAPSGIGDRGTRSDADHRLIAMIHVRDTVALYHDQLRLGILRGYDPSRLLRRTAVLVGVEPADDETDQALSLRVLEAVVAWLKRVVVASAPTPRAEA